MLCVLRQNVGEVYNASMSRQFQTSAVSVSQSAPVDNMSALSLAVDHEQLRLALARLLISPLGHHVETAAAATLVDGATRHRRRRPVDRSASEPLSSSVVESFCRYKTELCRPYEENGSCKYGDKCQFAHGRAELRPVARHPKYKTDLCKTYHTTGLCPYGPRCHFIHNDDERHLNELNRVVIEQQRALLRKQVLVQAAAAALARRRQLPRFECLAVDAGASAASRSASSPSSTAGDEPLTTASSRASCDDEVTWAAALTALRHRVRQAAPQMTDSEVEAFVTRILIGAVNTYNSSVYHRRQLQQQDTLQQQQPTVAQLTLNVEEQLVAL